MSMIMRGKLNCTSAFVVFMLLLNGDGLLPKIISVHAGSMLPSDSLTHSHGFSHHMAVFRPPSVYVLARGKPCSLRLSATRERSI